MCLRTVEPSPNPLAMNLAMASRAMGALGQYCVAEQPLTIPFAHR